MKPGDLPQDTPPRKIRTALAAVREGAQSLRDVSGHTDISIRHAGYALTAARALGFTERVGGHYQLTERGQQWLETPEGSAADRAVFLAALAQSPIIDHVAPGLTTEAPPTVAAVADRIRLLGNLAPETARRRAETLMRYRSYGVGGTEDLFPAETVERPSEALSSSLRSTPSGRPIRHVHVRNFGPLRDAEALIGDFAVLLGRNATGKTSFFDAIMLLAEMIDPRTELSQVLGSRATRLEELLWFGKGDSFSIAIEFSLPESARTGNYTVARYEIEIGRVESGAEPRILAEGFFLKDDTLPDTIVQGERTPRGWRKVLGLTSAGTAFYRSERSDWKTVFTLGPHKTAFSQLQEVQDRFPAALWVRDVLRSGVQRMELHSRAMRAPTSPLLRRQFLPDGSNLPLVVRALRTDSPERFRRWVGHVRLALPDLEDVQVRERPEDRHAYLRLVYSGGSLPSWRVSDGTLRLVALTLPAFLDIEDAVYLIEEPENGIHPQAIEVVYQALSACSRSQVLVATHSPVLLGIVPPERFLIFQKEGGQTRIAAGPEHPVLRDWRREADLATLFAAGVLG